MGREVRFREDWEPVVLADRVLADGTWTSQGSVEYNVRLLQRTWDYTSADIEAIEVAVADGINIDYIDYAISGDGNVFFWELRAGDGCTTSPHFSSFDAAKKHFSTCVGPSKIRWYVGK